MLSTEYRISLLNQWFPTLMNLNILFRVFTLKKNLLPFASASFRKLFANCAQFRLFAPICEHQICAQIGILRVYLRKQICAQSVFARKLRSSNLRANPFSHANLRSTNLRAKCFLRANLRKQIPRKWVQESSISISLIYHIFFLKCDYKYITTNKVI